VRELKRRKGRPHKPLAVMFADLAQARQALLAGAREDELLESPEHPIVLVDWQRARAEREPLGERTQGAEAADGGDTPGSRDADEPRTRSGPLPVDPEVAVRQRYLGADAAYTPLQLAAASGGRAAAGDDERNLARSRSSRDGEAGRLRDIPDDYLLQTDPNLEREHGLVALVAASPRPAAALTRLAPVHGACRRAAEIWPAGAELKNTFLSYARRDTSL